ncbi:MAG TPA: NACHT domain-containing protein, partial [Ktedonobacteraceae bacterium]|nr:NACHT domain-containing protein [Ktedonobacteraceae bacterium]
MREEQQQEAERRYLQRVIRDNENLIPKGVPGLVASVPLDEVFIPLQFKPGKPPSDKPITERERRWHRDFLQRYGHLYPQEAATELERALFLAEQDYERILEGRDRVDFAYLWQNCTRKEPAAIIQGYPGMGKSTLTQRLALYMAHHSFSLPVPWMAQADDIQPTLIPILIPLKEFADAREQNANLSLETFLTQHLEKLCIPGADLFVLVTLKSGRCLVMLDGLDEVSNPHTRKQVQEEIRTFVAANADVSPVDFNRFLITSRVAGYDLAAFPDYLHYLIAELSPEQINNFLPRWCRASVRNLRAPGANLAALPEQNEAITREANLLANKLSEAIAHNQGVRDMAETPLLLTLLAIMQQIRGVLPDRRIELYKAVTKTLLEDRNEARKLDPIPENQAIQYLSPLAFTMQETGNSFSRERDVLASLQKTMKESNCSLSDPDAVKEAKEFLQRIGERSGLFVRRTGDYFGFMHRTFQEYFAAHFLLSAIQTNQQQGTEDLVSRARRHGDLWREPFLFAVAYQSDSYGKIADQIIRSLLNTPQNASQEQREHDLLLATECIIEAKPLSIDTALELDIGARLLQTYGQAQSEYRFESCQQIENIIRRRLLSLPKNSSRPSMLTVLCETITDRANVPLQRA